ncbi:hypothetical protein [Desulfofustis limnaeus]|jgi:hypothetical protein|uniref:Uncharacterized protein n=1 Tax=Desulfofustis limnaeus TaxID=2740163 RepID=A0ABM7W5K9_9BACT|nr:hypothetical protein [Desulfofustis limnaeus]MDX9894620.1 hypothetical protein [Desulfofustis sp.]BDD86235.1 hypothetical protein DPPLL_06000 [Desulfofustis limnaeus]
MNTRQSRTLLWLAGALVLLAAAVMSFLPGEQGPALVRENGPVETLTVGLYVVACSLLLIRGLKSARAWHLTASFVVLLLAARELDLHARFTTMGILKSRYYLSPEVPGDEKAIVIVLMLAIAAITAPFLWRSIPAFLRSLRLGAIPAVAVALAFGCGVVSKLLDSFSSEIRALLTPLYGDSRTYLRVYEETLELAIPLYILLALWFSRAAQVEQNQTASQDRTAHR